MKILLADDDEIYRRRMAQALTVRGCHVTEASNGQQVCEALQHDTYDAAVLDLKMPHMDGLETLQNIQQNHPDLMVILVTGYGSIPTAMEAARYGAADYLVKPVEPDYLYGRLTGQEPIEYAQSTPSLDKVEWEHIQRVLTDCAGNVSEAARVLGVHRRSLQRKLQKHTPLR